VQQLQQVCGFFLKFFLVDFSSSEFSYHRAGQPIGCFERIADSQDAGRCGHRRRGEFDTGRKHKHKQRSLETDFFPVKHVGLTGKLWDHASKIHAL